MTTGLVTSPSLHMAAHAVLLLVTVKVGWDVWRYHRYAVQRDQRTDALEAETERLHERVDEVVAWLWDATGQPMPDVTPATTELPAWVPPSSGPVARIRYMGQHRA